MTARFDEATDPDCICAEDAAKLFSTVPWSRMVVLGDSVAAGIREPTAGYRNLSSDERVLEALRLKRGSLESVNLAKRDLTTSQIIESQLCSALQLSPDLVIVAAGGNDALRRSFNVPTVKRDLENLLNPLRDAKADVAVLGLFDIARSGLIEERYATVMAERFDDLDRVTGALAGELGCVFVDLHRHPRSRDPGIFSNDLLHCNARGHAIAAAACMQALAAYVDQRSAPSELD